MIPLRVQELAAFDIRRFQEIVGVRSIRRLGLLSRKLQKGFNGNPTIWHVNSSGVGGGVADILNFLIPFSTQQGVHSQWFVFGGDEEFFKITKSFHNALQGSSKVQIDAEMFSHYQEIATANISQMERLIEERHWSPPDVMVVHDPQPAGMIPHWRSRFPDTLFIWRGHIQFDATNWTPSHPGQQVWNLLLGFINQCDAAIFHLPEQVPEGIEVPVHFILPSINPLAHINRDLSEPAAAQFVDSTLSKYGLEKFQDQSIPLVVQNARFDPWKDPQGVIQAFREAQESLPKRHKRPHLLLVGPMAADDPEAHEILAHLGQLKDGDGTIHILPIFPSENGVSAGQAKALKEMGLDHRQLHLGELMELEINVFQTRADIIVAKSLREGFGLTVTGAGYHGKPRIVSQVGGLPAQVSKGNAVQVGGSPDFDREVSIAMTREWMVKLLRSPRLRKSMGAKAKRHVIRKFLPHRHLGDYFKLFLKLRLSKISEEKANQNPVFAQSGTESLGSGASV